MSRWLLDNEARLKKAMQRSFLVRIAVRMALAVAIAMAQHDERKGKRA
jgi:hypothetical protein